MNNSFLRFGATAAMLTGILSILYAVFFLFVSRVSEVTGILVSWILLGVTGFFAAAAYVALYQRLKDHEPGFALYTMLFGAMSAFAMLQHGAFEAIGILRSGAVSAANGAPSQVDAAGLASFGVIGVVAFLWGWLILRTGVLPRTLGYIGILNSVLLIVLFLATVFSSQTVILLSGGLTSVIVGPVWWIWLGRALTGDKMAVSTQAARA